jgi:hypothetical protein
MFSGKACVPENIHNDENWLKAMLKVHHPYVNYIYAIVSELES